LSYALQRAFQRWLNEASVNRLLAASIGNDPSLRDILRMARPTPSDNARRALFGWLTNKEVAKWAPATMDDLPAEVRLLDVYRKSESAGEQASMLTGARLRWDLLADAARGSTTWKAIARQMGPQALRINLNTPRRHEQGSLRGRGGVVRGGHPAPQPGQRRHSVRREAVPRPGRSAGFDPEPGGTPGQVRRRWHELLVAAHGGDQHFRQPPICWV